MDKDRSIIEEAGSKPSGLYIHIPFCRGKCLYCDFFSGGDALADWGTLVDSLLGELEERVAEPGGSPDTIYIGGGTPSLMPRDAFESLAEGIWEVTGCQGSALSEFTIEVNPEDVNEEKCMTWRRSGVSRVSMGIQSLSDNELRIIGRRHDSASVFKAYDILRKHFDNVTCDLMFGLPGQTLGSLRDTIDGILLMSPEHVSAYSLMFEDRTPISILRESGRLAFPSEEDCVEMWRVLSECLENSGYNRYEISNYAKPGYESVHNSRYWLGNPYLGIGPSAHSYDGVCIRRSNPTRLREYLERFSNRARSGAAPFYDEETLCMAEREEEMIMLRMRMREGLNVGEFSGMFGEGSAHRLIRNGRRYVDAGCLGYRDGYLFLTDDGIMIADEVIVSLFE